MLLGYAAVCDKWIAEEKADCITLFRSQAIIMEAWIDHPNVTAVWVVLQFPCFIATYSYPASSIHAGLQGQEAGNTLVDILWGAVNPSGRLPYTIAKSPSDYSADIGPNHDVDYTEGLYIDYRWFDLVCYVSSPLPGSSEC